MKTIIKAKVGGGNENYNKSGNENDNKGGIVNDNKVG
jgi:hypothetical protein